MTGRCGGRERRCAPPGFPAYAGMTVGYRFPPTRAGRLPRKVAPPAESYPRRIFLLDTEPPLHPRALYSIPAAELTSPRRSQSIPHHRAIPPPLAGGFCCSPTYPGCCWRAAKPSRHALAGRSSMTMLPLSLNAIVILLPHNKETPKRYWLSDSRTMTDVSRPIHVLSRLTTP